MFRPRRVVRDGKELEGPFNDETVLYENDQLTWTITVTNTTTDLTYRNVKLTDSYAYVDGDGVAVFSGALSLWGYINDTWVDTSTGFGLSPGETKTFINTDAAKVGVAYGGYTLNNTATVTYSYENSPESTATDFTENPVGYTLTVQYHGNGGTADNKPTKTETVYSATDPAKDKVSYPVADGANGFTREGYTFDGWYTEEIDGKEVTGEQQDLYSGATYFAHWTENEKTYGAGYFVLVPSAIPDGFDPTEGYSVDTYLPNTEGDTVTYGDDTNHKVDNTTGYIGYITQAAVDYWQQNNEGDDRVVIPADKISDFLRMPEEAGWGKVWTEYLSKTDVDDKALYTLVPYQINNHSLGVNWPNITPQTDGKYETKEVGYHVDCYIQGVEINVLYVKNDGSTMTYTHNQVNGNPIRSGDTYTVLGNDETGDNQNFILEGYTFTGWNTQADGSGTTYAAGKEISPLMNSLVLYAQWKKSDGATKDLSYTVEYYKDGVLADTETVTEAVWVGDTEIPVNSNKINTTNKYEGYKFEKTDPETIPETIVNNGVIKVYYVKEDTPDYTVTIWPADITIYTGGEVYGGVTDANGNLISESDDIEASGLPEPGYHLTLSTDVMTWLNEKTGTYGPRDLEDYLTFTYDVGGVIREWELTYVGVYDTNPTRYVYSLEPGKAENGEAIPVRLLFKDESGEVAYDDPSVCCSRMKAARSPTTISSAWRRTLFAKSTPCLSTPVP